MINKKYDWYEEALNQGTIIHEAQMSKLLQKAMLVISLILAGYTVFDVAKKTGLSPQEVEEMVENEELRKMIEEEKSFPLNALPIPKNYNQPKKENVKENIGPHGLPTELNLTQIEELVRLHEVSGATTYVTVNGKKVDIRKSYPDPIHGWKVPTIGIGYNLNRAEAKSQIESFGLDYNKVRKGEQSLTDQQVNLLYRNDIQKAIQDAKSFLPNFDSQPSTVKTILTDMSFNMGLTRLSTFKNFRKALMAYDFEKAAQEMENSNWSTQVKSRSTRLIAMMRSLVDTKKTKKIN